MSFAVLKTGVQPQQNPQLLYLPHITAPLSRHLQNPNEKLGFIQFIFGALQTCSFGSRTSTQFSNSSLIAKSLQYLVNKGFSAHTNFNQSRKSGKWKLTLYVDSLSFQTEHELC